MPKSVQEHFNDASRYNSNPYAGTTRSRALGRECYGDSNQRPVRMFVKKGKEAAAEIPTDEEGFLKYLQKFRVEPDMPTDDELTIYMASARTKANILSSIRNKYLIEEQATIANDPREQLSLTKRHRYGDDVDILRATFTKTIDEINDMSFELMMKVKHLHHLIMRHNEDIPKITKYRYGTLLENSVHNLLADVLRIQRRYYRKNMLEAMHIEVDILRTYLFECSVDYPKWMTSTKLVLLNDACNEVSKIIGGLLKSTVA